MKTNLFLDNCAWNVFFDRKIDLKAEFENSEFTLKITEEVAFEIRAIRHNALREYAENCIHQKTVTVDSLFGFNDESLPADEQRNRGFGCEYDLQVGGRFIEEDEAHLMRNENISSKKKELTRLFKHETDRALVARSLNSFVLTRDAKGAFKRAKSSTTSNGGIIDLDKFIHDLSLCAFIRTEIANLKLDK